MTIGNDPINAIENTCTEGLTKREYIAALAMQGVLANPSQGVTWTFVFWQKIRHIFGLKSHVTSAIGDSNNIAQIALNCTDALIKKLNQTP